MVLIKQSLHLPNKKIDNLKKEGNIDRSKLGLLKIKY